MEPPLVAGAGGAQNRHGFGVSRAVNGEGVPVSDRRVETANLYFVNFPPRTVAPITMPPLIRTMFLMMYWPSSVGA